MCQAHFDTTEERVDGGAVSREVGKIPRNQWAWRYRSLQTSDEWIAVDWLDHLKCWLPNYTCQIICILSFFDRYIYVYMEHITFHCIYQEGNLLLSYNINSVEEVLQSYKTIVIPCYGYWTLTNHLDMNKMLLFLIFLRHHIAWLIISIEICTSNL